MQSDAWFIEDVKNTRETRADLGRQSNALRFAARKRAAFAIERQITESDLDEKLQARLNFPNDFGHDSSLLRGQIQIVDVARGRFDRLFAKLMNV